MNYILKPKNRKLKTNLLYLTSKFRFGGVYLSKEKKYCLLSLLILVFSVFFPWFEIYSLDNNSKALWIASGFTGIALPLMIVIFFVCLFFIFSHIQKEKIRNYILAGLADGQIIMLLAVMMIVVLIDIKFFAVTTFEQFAPGGTPATLSGYILAFIGALSLYVSGLLIQKKDKKDLKELSYLDRNNQNDFLEYQEILGDSEGEKSGESEETKKKNMRLPI